MLLTHRIIFVKDCHHHFLHHLQANLCLLFCSEFIFIIINTHNNQHLIVFFFLCTVVRKVAFYRLTVKCFCKHYPPFWGSLVRGSVYSALFAFAWCSGEQCTYLRKSRLKGVIFVGYYNILTCVSGMPQECTPSRKVRNTFVVVILVIQNLTKK